MGFLPGLMSRKASKLTHEPVASKRSGYTTNNTSGSIKKGDSGLAVLQQLQGIHRKSRKRSETAAEAGNQKGLPAQLRLEQEQACKQTN